jgi:hypothetical protein
MSGRSRRESRRRVLLGVVAASFLSLALVSAGHLHSSTSGTVQASCQICSLCRSPVDSSAATPPFVVSALVVWLAPLPVEGAPIGDFRSLPPARGPPLL